MHISRELLYKWSTLTGVFLLLMPIGIHWLWGNLSIYVMSFYRCNSVRDTPFSLQFGNSWLISLFLLTRTIFFIIGGGLSRVVGQRVTIFVGICIFNLGILASYFALDVSIVAMDASLGFICGMGAGILYGPSLEWSVKWASKANMGLVISIVHTGYSVGAVLSNQFITLYVNPLNRKPNLSLTDFRFFSQLSVLGQVPSAFIVLFIMYSTIHVVGLALLRKNKTAPQKVQSESTKLGSSPSRKGPAPDSTASPDQPPTDSDGHPSVTSEHTPKQMLRSPTFYLLVVTAILSDYTYVMAVTYYKALGQLWIADDHFLTTIGTTMVIVSIPARLLCGLMLDRLGLKTTLVGAYCVTTVSAAFFYAVPMVSRELYLVDATVLAALTGTMNNIYVAASWMTFGREYGTINMGIFNLVSMGLMTLAPPIMQSMVSRGQWFSLCLSGTATSLVSLVVIVLFLKAGT